MKAWIVRLAILFCYTLWFSDSEGTEMEEQIKSMKGKKIIDSIIEPYMQEMGIPGIAIGYYDGENGQLYSYGYANIVSKVKITPETIFEIASVTKVFTSTLVALEVVKDKMKLTDPVAKYLPALKGTKAGDITLKELATHTSSLPRVPPATNKIYEKKSIIEFLQKWVPSYPIGTKYLYSNLGFGVLGYALANLEDSSFEEMVERNICKPLKMFSTLVHIPPGLVSQYSQGYTKNGEIAQRYAMNAWPAGGSLRSTARDLLKFLEANLGKISSRELKQAMELSQKEYFQVRPGFSMGLGWQRVKTKNHLIIDKNGGVKGFSSYIGMIPEKNIGIVILLNKGKSKSTFLGRKILNALVNE